MSTNYLICCPQLLRTWSVRLTTENDGSWYAIIYVDDSIIPMVLEGDKDTSAMSLIATLQGATA